MATLRHLESGADIPVAARHVVGRSRTCQLQVKIASVSALHAELTWTGQVWHLRDLGSRNGTFVSGERLLPGQPQVLRLGDGIGFGVPEPLYRLVDAGPPQLIAFGPDEIRIAVDDLLCLPSPDDCEAMIFCDADGRWVVETAQTTRPLASEDSVIAGDRTFQVHLPGSVAATRDAEELHGDAVDEGVFEFAVSRDGEHVDLRVRRGARVQPVEARAHAFLLLVLARARLADAAHDDLPKSEHGWLFREDLMKELAIDDPQLLNLWVYRARQQFAQMKLWDASKVIERRGTTGQLRLGLERLRVIDA